MYNIIQIQKIVSFLVLNIIHNNFINENRKLNQENKSCTVKWGRYYFPPK